MANYSFTFKDDSLEHHGIDGQKWGVRNGPPYPLKAGDHSAAEKRAMKENYKVVKKEYRKGNRGVKIITKNSNLSEKVSQEIAKHKMEFDVLRKKEIAVTEYEKQLAKSDRFDKYIREDVDKYMSNPKNIADYKKAHKLSTDNEVMEDLVWAYKNQYWNNNAFAKFMQDNPSEDKKYKKLLEDRLSADSQEYSLCKRIANDVLGEYAQKPIFAKVKNPGEYSGKANIGVAEDILAQAIYHYNWMKESNLPFPN